MAAPELKPEQNVETDPRFPSGPWIGFFLQKPIPGRHRMELRMKFANGAITGEGRDWVGEFILRGQYNLADGTCHWAKRYVEKHDVFYKGFNEGKGIWGTWELPSAIDPAYMRGGFHIWPEGMPDPTGEHLTESVAEPIIVEESSEVEQTDAVPVGGRPGVQEKLQRNG